MKANRENQLHIPPENKNVHVFEQPKEPVKVYGPESVLQPGILGNFEPAEKKFSSGPGNSVGCVVIVM